MANGEIQETYFAFAEWLGNNYTRLGRVWVGKFSDQRNKELWKSTEDLFPLFLSQYKEA
jgi:hypothetical protein